MQFLRGVALTQATAGMAAAAMRVLHQSLQQRFSFSLLHWAHRRQQLLQVLVITCSAARTTRRVATTATQSTEASKFGLIIRQISAT